MKALKATQEQFDLLNGWVSESGEDRLEFRLDGAGNWVCGVGNLTNPAFAPIADELAELVQIDFLPVQSED